MIAVLHGVEPPATTAAPEETDWSWRCDTCGTEREPDAPLRCRVCGEVVLEEGWTP
jgi:rubrerythrin